ncbi:ATP-binding protein [Streptomyces sp. NPDC058417]|uniref:ATP-binding protein n=1 Tax=unclassified Streptomyces TaxID=2593676 RepID=UPI00365A4BA2
MNELIAAAAPSVLAAASAGAALHYRRRARRGQREIRRLTNRERGAAETARAVEEALRTLAFSVIPALKEAAGREGGGHGADFVLPAGLAGQPVAVRLGEVADALARAMRAVQSGADAWVKGQAADMRRQAVEVTDRTQRAADEQTRAAVRSAASALVAVASRVSKQISAASRRSDGGGHAALEEIDHLVQQLLLVAQSYTVLSGGRLTRRWPPAVVTDVLRAAMGHVQGYQRISYEESGVLVTTRAVGPVIQALALLLDNALRFSQPQSRVDIRLQDGHHGIGVEICDAGVGLTQEDLLTARAILSGERGVDVTRLGAHPRIGFPVVGLLALRYGFRVEVLPSNAYGGTSVVLFLPNALLDRSGPTRRVPPAAAIVAADGQRRTAGGLQVRVPRRNTAAAPDAAADGGGDSASAPAGGTPAVFAAWAQGTGRARRESIHPHSHEQKERDL